MNIKHLNTNGAPASWTAAVRCRFPTRTLAFQSARGLAQSKAWRLAEGCIEYLPSCILVALLALVSAVHAASPPASLTMIPPQINYQGRLVTPANVPYNDATHTIDLSLYPTASGGTTMWSERYAVQTRDGYFSVNLGSGGTGLLASNPPIWQVLWKADGASPDNFFMALTVRTDPTGAVIPSPLEATPRQQFLTAPFAYRAHQSVYATKADGLFNAAQGVQTPTLSSTTNEISVTASTRVNLSATRVNAVTPNLEINGRPMFVSAAASASGTTRTFSIPSGIDSSSYNVVIAGWTCTTTGPAIQSVFMNPFAAGTAGVTFATTPASSVTVTVMFLGIAKELY